MKRNAYHSFCNILLIKFQKNIHTNNIQFSRLKQNNNKNTLKWTYTYK